MSAGLDFSLMRQRGDETDGAVAAHGEAADIIKKNHAGRAGFVLRLNQQRPHQNIRAARLVDNRRTKAIMLAAKTLQLPGHRSAAEFRTAGHHHPGGLPARVRINHRDLIHFRWGILGRFLMPS